MKPVPNICQESGISYEFRSAYRTLNHYIERVEADEPARTRYLALRTFRHREIQRYQEYFDPEKYERVITPVNQAAVAKLNEIVDRLNAVRKSKDVNQDLALLLSLRAELEAVISGKSLSR